MAKKIKKAIPKQRIYLISRSFLKATESEYSTTISNILTLMATNATYPSPPTPIADIKKKWDTYDGLRVLCDSEARSPKLVNERNNARFELSLEMSQLIFYVQLIAKNDYEKLITNTGFTVEGMGEPPVKYQFPAPSNIKYKQIEGDGITGLQNLQVTMNAQKDNIGAQYRLKLEGQTDYAVAVSFTNGKKRVIPGLKKDAKGVFQVRWLGGLNNQSEWSDDVPFTVI